MAAVHTLHTMTLGQANKMYNVVQHSTGQNNCVIVSQANTKSVIHKRPLAPAPTERSSVLVTANSSSDLRCKRKIQFNPYGGPAQQPASVARRNARERNRVKQVNNGFATLRQHIPASVSAALSPQAATTSSGRGQNKKLSKVETLRLAVEYIRSLQQMIEDHENDMTTNRSGGGINQHHHQQSNIMDNTYYSSSSPESVTHQQFTYPVLLPTPTCSEASASPTPSHSSESSISNSIYSQNIIYAQDNYENYDPKSPEDEELLDAIFSWQHD